MGKSRVSRRFLSFATTSRTDSEETAIGHEWDHVHDVMVVARQDGDTLSTLPVPNANGLVVGGGQDPGMLVVEVD